MVAAAPAAPPAPAPLNFHNPVAVRVGFTVALIATLLSWIPALNVVLWVAGVILIAVGYSRARGPWARYQALKAQDANVARYGAWRGGVRDDSTTGASVAMDILRRQAQIGAGIAIAGVVLVFFGFLIH